jgi:hypothetical protein
MTTLIAILIISAVIAICTLGAILLSAKTARPCGRRPADGPLK